MTACCFCDENLGTLLEGESAVDLTCGDSAHWQCYLAMLTPHDLSDDGTIASVECLQCHSQTKCKPASRDDVARELLLGQVPLARFKTPDNPPQSRNQEFSDPRSISSANTSPMVHSSLPLLDLSLKSPPIPQTAFPQTAGTPESPILQDSLIPKVLFVPSKRKIQVDSVSPVELDCTLTVLGPRYERFNIPECGIGEILESFVNNLRFRVQDWRGVDVDDLGSLIIADRLKIGIDRSSFEFVDVYLFEKCILLIGEAQIDEEEGYYDEDEDDDESYEDDAALEVVGSIETALLSGCSHTQIYELTVHLSSVRLPELIIQTDSSLILKRWSRCLNRTIKGIATDMGPDQVTSNLWSSCSIPRLRNPSGTEASHVDSGPVVEAKVSLVVVVDPALASSRECLNISISSLKHGDMLGIVFVNRTVNTFYGMAPSDWEGWRDVVANCGSNYIRETKDGFENNFDTNLESCAYPDIVKNLERLAASSFAVEDLLCYRHGFRQVLFMTDKELPVIPGLEQLAEKYNLTFTNCYLKRNELTKQSISFGGASGQRLLWNLIVHRHISGDIGESIHLLISHMHKGTVSEMRCRLTAGVGVELVSMDGYVPEYGRSKALEVHANNLWDKFEQSFNARLRINVDQVDLSEGQGAVPLVEFVTRWCEDEFDDYMSTTTRVSVRLVTRSKDIPVPL
ncbi:unnamed protein product [Kuraishia capsulata CBS 1993]|uniref:Uncharacterized protein n=1 Tax=Kuraishia capsulata CBS 1993 TaxID=1382522 RepID=W6MG23_9ASCO|nr:uncharacterized protein KUCA_T00000345001 [Kuraishia capsulata CBS 1993]CDK24383.1 unnamed protein product [Kuraishia capsulata CBS 1993]